jgi:hypothetical protein
MSDSQIEYGPKGNSKELESILNYVLDSNMKIDYKDKKPTPVCIWAVLNISIDLTKPLQIIKLSLRMNV